MPEQKSTIWFIRFVIVCPVLFGTLLASFSKSFERYMQPLLAGVFILAGGGIICMIVIAPPPVNYSYYAGLLLVFMWGYTFIRILFTWASLAGWVQVVLYEIAAIWISPTPFAVLIGNNFFFISANVIGMLACYSIEFYARRDFFLRQQLEIEQEKVNKVNQELEERVEKRTADYQIINRALEQEITDRKQAEAALRKSEDKYRTLIETTDTGFVIIDQDGLVLDANSEYVRLAGHHDLSEIVGRSVLEWTADSEKEKNAAAVKACFEQGYIRNLEIDYVDAQGSITPIEINATCMEIEGKIQTITICRDITQRKQAEDAVRQSEEKYRTILENIDDGYYEVDLSGNFTFFNDSMCRILGYPQEEMMGMNNRQFTDKENAKKLFKTFNEVYRTGKPAREFNWWIIRKDGTKRNIEVSVSLQRNSSGEPIGFRGISRDITERKEAEEALREAEKKYRLIAENTADLISILDMNLRFTYVSPASIRLRGFTVEEAMGQTLDQVLTPESMQRGLTVFEKEMQLEAIGEADPDRMRILELEEYKKDGSTIWVEVSLSFLRDNNHKPVEILIVTRDITERKQTEQEKRNLEERLQRSEKMEALGLLAGGVAHDLNNVLGVIVGYSELLLNEVDSLSPVRPRLTKIMNGSEKAAAIVQDLLTLARRGVPGRKVLNLNKIILDYQNSPELEKLFSYHSGVRIKFDLESGLLNISGSAVHLGKMLSNLVSNAVEAMPKGGDLTIKTANQYLDKPIYGYDQIREGDYVVLTVTDTGEGIPSVDRQRIFEPFYTKKVMGRSGTGLGLAVVWGTVKDHQGYINVQSEEGKGSTFTLYFPVTREEISIEAASVSISEYMGKGETILVVDDVREQRDLATEMLKKLNYKVSSVSSGEGAVTFIKEHKVDLLVLDMIMDPGMDGLDTYKSVLAIQPKQKAIIVSGYSETERVNDAHALGAGEYVKKPYVIEKLGMAVRSELDRTT
jgi:PAS domain S-box-containing protein